MVNDDYILPEGYEDMQLVSAMFKITASDILPVAVTVRMEHCAVVKKDNSLVHMIAHGLPPFKFKLLEGGIFPIGEFYGKIKVKKISTLTQVQKEKEHKMSLSVHIFYHTHCTASFVVTRNLKALVQALKKKYASIVNVVENLMLCDHSTEAITFSIPQDNPGGWHVEAEFKPPMIATRLI